MSLKSIEMQIAIPRTQDAGSAQNQLSHKPLHDQAQLAGEASKMTEELRRKSGKVNEAFSMLVNEEGSHQNPHERKSMRSTSTKTEKKASDERTEHPYKGHHIDLTL